MNNHQYSNKFTRQDTLDQPLLEGDASDELLQLQTDYMIFQRDYNDIKEFKKKIDTMEESEFQNSKDSIHKKIQSIPQILLTISKRFQRLESVEVLNPSLKYKLEENIKNIKKKIKTRKEEIAIIMNEIVSKEKSRKDFYTAAPTEQEFEKMNSPEMIDTMLQINDIDYNERILKQREEELKEIQLISEQMKDLSMDISWITIEQGNSLSIIS